jgi:hypothetical protein
MIINVLYANLVGNQFLVLFAILTRVSITGTSTSTPTTVTMVAPELSPNTEIATATANSKKFEAPIIPAGAAMAWGSFHALAHKYATKKIKKVCIMRGIAISTICSGLFTMIWPWKEKMMISVRSKPTMVTWENFGIKMFSK